MINDDNWSPHSVLSTHHPLIGLLDDIPSYVRVSVVRCLGSQDPVTFAILSLIGILSTSESARTVTHDVVKQFCRYRLMIGTCSTRGIEHRNGTNKVI